MVLRFAHSLAEKILYTLSENMSKVNRAIVQRLMPTSATDPMPCQVYVVVSTPQKHNRCPSKREIAIAEHACLKYSGRVGRSAAAKSLDENAVRIAVIAHIRHAETPYDELLMKGYERRDARAQVEEVVRRVLTKWEASE